METMKKLLSSIFPRIQKHVPLILFFSIVILLFLANAFPALYGDEYGSLNESKGIFTNLHAIGYFIQLNFWHRISNEDWFLRLLSVFWLGIGIFWFTRWLLFEKVNSKVIRLATVLLVINPFLWMYGFQIRFYSYFFATSILFVWRFRCWQEDRNHNNVSLLSISLLLLLTAHLFGFLVFLTLMLAWLLSKIKKGKWYILWGLGLIATLTIIPSIRLFLISIVLKYSNAYANISTDAISRGLNISMLAKIPFTFYFFILGERVYPLWWWLTIPAMLVTIVAFLAGLQNTRQHKNLFLLIILMLLNIPLMFLFLDPLAPPDLQGAAPRYVIFVLPFLILLLAFGAQSKKWIRSLIILISLGGLIYLAFPSWSYGGIDFMNWPYFLNNAIRKPQQTCVIYDGRSVWSIRRYLSPGYKITSNLDDCSNYQNIAIITNDFHLDRTRSFDLFGEQISNDYILSSNMALFPAQITVFEKSSNGNLDNILPSHMDIPEQDLRFPIQIPGRNWQLDGFTRLDQLKQSTEIPLNLVSNTIWVLSNYYIDASVPFGTPVFSLEFTTTSGKKEVITIKTGVDTSSWTGTCTECSSIYKWSKLIHFVGSGFGY